MADNWQFMKAADAISGKEGTLYATIEGNVVPVAECKSISAKVTKNKSEFKALGYRGTQHKATGWNGSGSMTLYYVTSLWTKIMLKYVKDGVDIYFKLQFTNEDPTATDTGKQVITLGDVNLDDIEVAKFDTESQFLDQQLNFTFSGIDMANSDMFNHHQKEAKALDE